jgi:DNA-binding CsgD family transcriptional regulator
MISLTRVTQLRNWAPQHDDGFSRMAELVLDRLATAAAVLDRGGIVRFHNRQAELVASAGDDVVLRMFEPLRFRDPSADATLRAILREEPTGESQFIIGGGEQKRALAELSGLGDANTWIVVLSASRNASESEALLCRDFGLTAAETRIACQIASGATLAEAAAAFGISRHTVRNQLRSVFVKFGIRRQSDIAQILRTSASAFIDDSKGH